jgi:transposase
MDFYCIEALLALPEFRVISQVLGPTQLDLHLERRDDHVVCPRCQTCCSRVKESRPRCICDLPILERPVRLWLHLRRFQCPECRHRPWETSTTFGEHTKWTERLYNGCSPFRLGADWSISGCFFVSFDVLASAFW